jgi:hypothetical protein
MVSHTLTGTTWIPFYGRSIDTGSEWVLEAPYPDGSIAIAREDARMHGPTVEIRVGALVRILKRPIGGGRPASIAARSCSIGLVEISCETSRVLGPGAGMWDECAASDE